MLSVSLSHRAHLTHNIGSASALLTRALIAVQPRRPPMTDVGTETAFRLDQRKHFQKSKRLLRSEVSWCDQTSIDLHPRQSTCTSLRSIYMLSVTDFDPKGTISEVRVHAGLYLDILDADRSPNAVRFYVGTTQVDLEVDCPPPARSTRRCSCWDAQHAREPMQSRPIPQYPWQFVSQDIFHWKSGAYLLTVDHFSDFFEVDPLPDTLAATFVMKSRVQFSRHGIPEVLLSDNGPRFISVEVSSFCELHHIDHWTSSTYWPQGNGKAEAAVKVAKSLL